MTAKEKARELVNKMIAITLSGKKRNATTCVDEILNELYILSDCGQNVVDKRDYYEQVREEIQLIS